VASAREWLEGARLRTLPASVSPILAGIGIAWFATPTGPPFTPNDWAPLRAVVEPLLCLVVGLGLQIGSNFANDYSDGVRGTDAHRVGPMRLVGSGAAAPAAVKRAAWTGFLIACLAGLALMALTTPLFSPARWRALFADPAAQWAALAAPVIVVLVGLACVVAAWFYTGGRHPYGYAGWGELFVFIFFGLVAAIGTAYFLAPSVCAPCSAGACPGCVRDIAWAPAIVNGIVMGCLATAILVANNLRDLASDRTAGKITLPVRLGDRGTRVLYLGCLIVAGAGLVVLGLLTSPFAWIGLAGMLLVVRPAVRVWRGVSGRELIHVLKLTGQAELATALLLGAGLGIGWYAG